MRTAFLSGVCVLLLLLDAAAPAQTLASATFDVASIRPSPPDAADTIRFMGNALLGGWWNAKGATLVQMIRSVYPGHSLPGQLTGGPAWVRSTRRAPRTRRRPARSSSRWPNASPRTGFI